MFISMLFCKVVFFSTSIFNVSCFLLRIHICLHVPLVLGEESHPKTPARWIPWKKLFNAQAVGQPIFVGVKLDKCVVFFSPGS